MAKQTRINEILQRLNDHLVMQKTLNNGRAVKNIEKLIAFFEKKKGT